MRKNPGRSLLSAVFHSAGISFPVYLAVVFAMAGCSSISQLPPSQVMQQPAISPQTTPPATRTPPSPISTVQEPGSFPQLRPSSWETLPGWEEDQLAEAWPAWLQSCKSLGALPAWQQVCQQASRIDSDDRTAISAFFQMNFQPYQVVNDDNTSEGLVTGYYEPTIRGDRVRTDRARHPVYGPPPDLITVDLASVYPDLKSMRLRGRLSGNRLLPYYTREEIQNNANGFSGTPIAWAEDPVDLFFLHIEGSGRIELPNGEGIRIGYADQNGHPFRSIARILIDQGEIAAHDASKESIKRWGKQNPDRLAELLNKNPSYVFFRYLDNSLPGPIGALGVPLTTGRSIAIDRRFIPLGAPVYLATSWPLSDQPLNRLVLAQDTGGAIRGAVRVDLFWGPGDDAGLQANRMKQSGKAWVLLPLDFFTNHRNIPGS